MYATCRVTLKTGLRVKDEAYVEFTLREATVGDMLAAEQATTNEFRKGVEVLARQIVSMEASSGASMPGPANLALIGHLTHHDLNLLCTAAESLAGVVRGEPAAVSTAGH